jgi:hypothetical protein
MFEHEQHRTINDMTKRPFLRQQTISSINELYPFFYVLSNTYAWNQHEHIITDDKLEATLNAIELSIFEDFVESWT